MDKKTKILNILFLSTIIFSLVITFYKTVILQDFVIVNYEEETEDSGVEEEALDTIAI